MPPPMITTRCGAGKDMVGDGKREFTSGSHALLGDRRSSESKPWSSRNCCNASSSLPAPSQNPLRDQEANPSTRPSSLFLQGLACPSIQSNEAGSRRGCRQSLSLGQSWLVSKKARTQRRREWCRSWTRTTGETREDQATDVLPSHIHRDSWCWRLLGLLSSVSLIKNARTYLGSLGCFGHSRNRSRGLYDAAKEGQHVALGEHAVPAGRRDNGGVLDLVEGE